MQSDNMQNMPMIGMNITDHNKKSRDSNGKVIFEDNILCAQFLQDYVPLSILKSVRPEDIEDISERYVPLFTSEREADVVKRIRLKDENPVFLVSLIEHKTEVDYNVIMQLLRYMCYIWEDYQKEMLKKREEQREREKQRQLEKQSRDAKGQNAGNLDEEVQAGVDAAEPEAEEKILTSTYKDFKYPPIIPIIYYEGKGEWTAAMNLKDRIYLSDIFEAYIPDFTYVLMRLHDYSNEQLMEHGNEMSLILLLNKLQSLADLEGLSELKDYQQNVIANTPEHLLDIIATITTILLTRLKLPSQEIEGFVSLIKEKKMPELFEKFEEVDVPKLRNELRAQIRAAKADQEKAKADQEKAKADIDWAKAAIEKAQADIDWAQSAIEKTKADQEKAKADQEKAWQQIEMVRAEMQAKEDEMRAKEEAIRAREKMLQEKWVAIQAEQNRV